MAAWKLSGTLILILSFLAGPALAYDNDPILNHPLRSCKKYEKQVKLCKKHCAKKRKKLRKCRYKAESEYLDIIWEYRNLNNINQFEEWVSYP